MSPAQGRKGMQNRNLRALSLVMFFWIGFTCLRFGRSLTSARGFVSRLPCFQNLPRAPRPIAFRLRGQDPLMILALGDLQWARGPFCSSNIFVFFFLSYRLPRLLLSVLVLSCPGAEKRDPPYPPLVGSPSLPTPCEDREDGYKARGGRWGFLSCPLGLVIAKPYSCRGLAWFLVLFV